MNVQNVQEITDRLGEIAQQITEGVEQDALEEFAALWSEVQEAIEEVVEIFTEYFMPVIRAVRALYEDLQRMQLYLDLPAWVPDRMALAVSRHCPRRWLPDLSSGGEA
jgi:hypothetical protein